MRREHEQRGEQIRESARHVLVLHNPKAGSEDRAARIDELATSLERRGFRPMVITELAQLLDCSDELLKTGGLRAVVAAGGDGTAGAVANHTPDGTPMAIFPLGTENLFAKYLGYSADVGRMADTIEHGNCRRYDACEVQAGETTGRLFLVMTGCGFDAEVIHRLHRKRRGHITHLSYARPILHAIRKYNYPALRVHCLDRPGGQVTKTILAHWAFVFNTPSYAVGLPICPDAEPTDGLLDIVTFRGGSFWQGLVHLGNVLLRRQRRSRRVENVRTAAVRIESDEHVPIQVDGDPSGALPVEIAVRPGRIMMLVPA